MNSYIDTLLIIILKLVLMVGFILLIKLWLKKTRNIAPIIIYAILGIFFVLMMSYHFFEYILTMMIYNGNNIDTIRSVSVILGLAFYILVYRKYLLNFRKSN